MVAGRVKQLFLYALCMLEDLRGASTFVFRWLRVKKANTANLSSFSSTLSSPQRELRDCGGLKPI